MCSWLQYATTQARDRDILRFLSRCTDKQTNKMVLEVKDKVLDYTPPMVDFSRVLSFASTVQQR